MSAPGYLRRRVRDWINARWVYLFLAVIVYIPPMLVRRGVVSADNKVYLYLDPGRMLSDAAYLWDPNTFAGTVPHQGVGYLFPVAPYYWLTHQLGITTWVAQRFWLSTVVFFAGAGVVYLLRTLKWRGPGVLVAAVAYMMTPYFMNYASAFTVIALPWTGLPWLIALSMQALRHKGWRYPALFAITIQLIGSVNASSLAFSILAAVLWYPFAVMVNREVTWRQAVGTLLRTGFATFMCSLWWMSGLWAQSRYGIDVLRYSETARTVAAASMATEVLRGLGYWYFYGADKLTLIVDASRYYTRALWLLGLSFLVPVLALLATGIARFRERAYFTCLILVGLVLAVGAYPWHNPPLVGGFFKWFVSSSQYGSAMRSMPRAAPLVILGLAVMLGAAVTSVHEKMRLAGIPQPVRFIKGVDRRVLGASAILIVLLIANQPSMFTGWFITSGISRPSDIPTYWKQDAAALNAGDHSSRIFEIPGSNFASYRWDGKLVSSVDPITPGLTDRPFVAREQVPYGTLPTANLLAAFDDRMQQNVLEPKAIAPVARFLSAGDLNVRGDLAWERYGTVRPTEVWDMLSKATGLGPPQIFGGKTIQQTSKQYPMLDEATLGMRSQETKDPRLAIVPVKDSPSIVKSAPVTGPVILDGDGSGLVSTAGAGLLTGRELVLYSGTYADDPAKLRALAADDPTLVVTDSNRRRGQRWGTIQDAFGETETAGQTPLTSDPSDQRIDIFDDAGGDTARTVAVQRGGVHAEATSYGNIVTYTPDVRAALAVDGNLNTAWVTGAFGPVKGEALLLTFDDARTTDHITFRQPNGGHPNRWITKVKLTFDNGFTTTVDLGPESRKGNGQTVTFPTQTFRNVKIAVAADNAGKQHSYRSLSSVGFAEVTVGDNPPTLTEYIKLPSDLMNALGASSLTRPLAIVLTRDRVNQYNALRTDSERYIGRTWDSPVARSYAITGTARLAPGAAPATIDSALGMPTAAQGGVDVTESRHLSGTPTQRATASIDGDPDSWWSTGFLSSVGNYAQFKVAKPVTFDHFNLKLVADKQHSVPTKLDVTVDGKTVRVDVPAITASPKIGTVKTVPIKLPAPMTGTTVRFTIRKQHSLRTNDWYTNNLIALPIAVAEWGVPGLEAKVPSASTPLSTACNSKLMLVNGKVVPVSIKGTVGDALASRALGLELCEPSNEVALTKGTQNLLTADGGLAGFNIDQLVLRSAAGGKADQSTGILVPAPSSPQPVLKVTSNERTKMTVKATGATKPFWLVLGQSQSDGWQATANGHSLGTSTLVDGYANGWMVTPDAHGVVNVQLVWTPQRVVWIAIGISALSILACLALALFPMRKRRLAPLVEDDLRRTMADPSVPLPFEMSRLLQYRGAAPKLGQSLGVTVVAGLAGGALVGWWATPIVGIVALLAMRFRTARPLLTLGPPVCLAAAAGYYLLYTFLRHPIADFGWPGYFSRVAPLGWFAIIFLVLDLIVDRFWLRRWWPSAESEL